MATSTVAERTVKLPFTLNALGNVNTTSDPTTVWGDRVRVVLGTLKKERLHDYEFGTRIPLHTMEPMRTLEEMVEDDISTAFSRHLPLLKLKDVVTQVNSEEGTINVEVFYELPTNDLVTTHVGFAAVDAAGLITEIPL